MGSCDTNTHSPVFCASTHYPSVPSACQTVLGQAAYSQPFLLCHVIFNILNSPHEQSLSCWLSLGHLFGPDDTSHHHHLGCHPCMPDIHVNATVIVVALMVMMLPNGQALVPRLCPVIEPWSVLETGLAPTAGIVM